MSSYLSVTSRLKNPFLKSSSSSRSILKQNYDLVQYNFDRQQQQQQQQQYKNVQYRNYDQKQFSKRKRIQQSTSRTSRNKNIVDEYFPHLKGKNPFVLPSSSKVQNRERNTCRKRQMSLNSSSFSQHKQMSALSSQLSNNNMYLSPTTTAKFYDSQQQYKQYQSLQTTTTFSPTPTIINNFSGSSSTFLHSSRRPTRSVSLNNHNNYYNDDKYNNIYSSTNPTCSSITPVYKGLQELTMKQLRKAQYTKQARQDVKSFGIESLRYKRSESINSGSKYQKNKQSNDDDQVQKKNKSPLKKSSLQSNRLSSGSNSNSGKYLSNQAIINQKVSPPISSLGSLNSVKDYASNNYENVHSQYNTSPNLTPYRSQKPTTTSILKQKSSWKVKNHASENAFDDIPQDKQQQFGTMKNVKRYAQLGGHKEEDDIDDQLFEFAPSPTSKKFNSSSIKGRSSIQDYGQHHLPQNTGSAFYSSVSPPVDMYSSGSNFFPQQNLTKKSNKSTKSKGPIDADIFQQMGGDGEGVPNYQSGGGEDDGRQIDQIDQNDLSCQEHSSLDNCLHAPKGFPNQLQFNGKVFYKLQINGY